MISPCMIVFLVGLIYLMVGLFIATIATRFIIEDDDPDSFLMIMVFYPAVLLTLIFLGMKVMLDLLIDRVIDRYLESNRRLIISNEWGELWEGQMRTDRSKIEECRWVHVKDKNNEHWIRVPPSIKSPKEGIAWSLGLKEEEYNPDVET